MQGAEADLKAAEGGDRGSHWTQSVTKCVESCDEGAVMRELWGHECSEEHNESGAANHILLSVIFHHVFPCDSKPNTILGCTSNTPT